VDASLSSELYDFIVTLSNALDGGIGGAAVEAVVNRLLAESYSEGDQEARFPGEIFGPTALPPGKGSSTEIAVDHADTDRMLDAVYRAIDHQARHHGRHHLGAFGVRFVPNGTSLVGMNQAQMTTYIELGGIRTDESLPIFDSVFASLDDAGVSFTCHWGQLGGFSPVRVERYFGDNAAEWKRARKEILPSEVARRVFAAALLADAGLD
jgi:hypothetical protein